MIGRNFFSERITGPTTDGEATGTTIPSQAPTQITMDSKGFNLGERRGAFAAAMQDREQPQQRINWYEFYSLLADYALVDSAGGSEYRGRTTELIEQNVLAGPNGESVSPTDILTEDKLFITKPDARKEFLRYFEDLAFLFS